MRLVYRIHRGFVGMRRFLQTILRGYGWRLGALAAAATFAALAHLVR
jgi:hypothetical protein